MFVILVGGCPNQRGEFMKIAEGVNDDSILWINDRKSFYYIGNLFVDFGGSTVIPHGKPSITWSGHHHETLERVYKTLGV
jgi:hypothetical protein